MNLKKEIRLFLAPIRRELNLSRRYKVGFLGNLEITANGYLQDHPNITSEELKQALGDPKELLGAYTESIGVEEIRKSYRRSKWITVGVVVAVALVLITLVYLWMYAVSFPTVIIATGEAYFTY